MFTGGGGKLARGVDREASLDKVIEEIIRDVAIMYKK
jgi:hypothetical protein